MFYLIEKEYRSRGGTLNKLALLRYVMLYFKFMREELLKSPLSFRRFRGTISSHYDNIKYTTTMINLNKYENTRLI